MEQAYPTLWQLFGGYFHQDWNLAGPDWRAVVDAYVTETDPEMAHLAAAELGTLLRETPDDDELRRIVPDDFDCCYLPEPGGLTMRAWLSEMQRILASA